MTKLFTLVLILLTSCASEPTPVAAPDMLGCPAFECKPCTALWCNGLPPAKPCDTCAQPGSACVYMGAELGYCCQPRTGLPDMACK